MTGHRIRLPAGFRLDKRGRLVRSDKHLDVSRRLQQRASKRIRVQRPTPKEK